MTQVPWRLWLDADGNILPLKVKQWYWKAIGGLRSWHFWIKQMYSLSRSWKCQCLLHHSKELHIMWELSTLFWSVKMWLSTKIASFGKLRGCYMSMIKVTVTGVEVNSDDWQMKVSWVFHCDVCVLFCSLSYQLENLMYYTENNHSKVVLRDFYLSKFENGSITEPCGTPEYLGNSNTLYFDWEWEWEFPWIELKM